MNLHSAQFRTVDRDDDRTVIMQLNAKGLAASFALTEEQAHAIQDGLEDCIGDLEVENLR